MKPSSAFLLAGVFLAAPLAFGSDSPVRRLPFIAGESIVTIPATDAELALDSAFSREENLRRLAEAFVRWPHERDLGPGVEPLYPRGTNVDSVFLREPDVVVRLTTPPGW